MRATQAFLLLVYCVLIPNAAGQVPKLPDAKASAKKEKAEPVAGYKTHKIEGFTFLVAEEVFSQDLSGYERKPLESLELECKALVKAMSPKAVEALRGLLIWADWDDHVKLTNGRTGNALAVYYGGSEAQMIKEGKHPLRAKTVTVHSLKMLTEGRQPKKDRGDCVLLHEFAHAVHDQVIGFNNPAIKAAYQQAMERKLYDKDQYVATNDREFFAELSCAYLDQLRYFPHNRTEFQKHDPASFKVIEAAWAGAAKKDVGKPVVVATDGSDRFDLDLWLPADVKFGKLIAGTAITPEVMAGKVVIVGYWGGNSANVLNRLDKLQSELGEYGVLAIAPCTTVRAEEITKAEAAKRGTAFAVLEKAFVRDKEMPGTLKTQPSGHALVFDHTGKCVFRGSAYDADKPLRAALGRKLLAEAFGDTDPPAAFKPVIDAFAAGGDPVAVLAKINPLTTSKDEATKDGAKKLSNALLAPGQQALDNAQASAKSDPVTALITAEGVSARYKGTSLATKADSLLSALRQDKMVAGELRARTVLSQLQKMETFLQGQPGSFDPSSTAFQTKHRATLDQMQAVLDQLRKQYPTARATAAAEKVAAEFGLR